MTLAVQAGVVHGKYTQYYLQHCHIRTGINILKGNKTVSETWHC